jgi:hypothetical protein
MGKSLEFPHVTLFSDIVFLKFVFNEKEFLNFALLCFVLCLVSSSSADSNPSSIR